VLYILFISLASAHHLLVDPGFSPAWKIVNTSYFMYMAVLASMVHGFTVPAGMELGLRLRGFTQGLFGWLRRAPWSDPGFSSLVLSVVVFGFFGGITGVTIGTEQINILVHNTLRVPGHFHATVVSGTALAFMGVTYYLLPLIFRRKVAFWGLAKWQPWLFAGGLLLVEFGMTFAGSFGVPRRHWDISFSQAPFDVQFNPAVDLFLAMIGIGAIIGVTGALSFILIAVKSVFFGEKVEEFARGTAMRGVPQGLTNPPVYPSNVDELNEKLHSGGKLFPSATPGTLVLVGIFLAAFMLYYFTNWKLLSFLWKIG
jgi:cytochrome c oxidase subunit 1